MTTAQERRRARRLARAQAAGAAPVEPVGAVEVVDVVEVVAVDAQAAAPAVEPIAKPIDARTTFGWIAVEPTAGSVAARPRRAADPTKRWVAVPARRALHPPPALPPAPTVERASADTPAQLPAEPRAEHDRDAHAAANDARLHAPVARALHPKTRAIRITRVKTNGRRRWSVDFLVRQPDMHLPK